SDLPGQNDEALWAYLGTAGERSYLARLLPATGKNGQQLQSLRSAGQFLPGTEAALATTAVALANWHRRHTHCPGCGRPTEVVEAGWVRRCPAEGTDHFPRTDPAVIMAITDPDDRLLLARSAHWPQGRFSVPAGFVEPGESLEQAVRREVGEETTIRVQDVTYRGTQPWPFPGSLMCGFTGTTTDTAPHPDGAEIAEARFFTRAELNLHWQSGSIRPPGAISIAHALISQWFGGPIPSPSQPPPRALPPVSPVPVRIDGDDHSRTRRCRCTAGRPGRGPARRGPAAHRSGVRPGRRRNRQDPRDHLPHRPRRGHRHVQPHQRARSDLHRPGGRADAQPAERPRGPRRAGP